MLSLSLDTNCVIALDEVRSNPESHRAAEAKAIRALLNAHTSGTATIGIIAISASERQRDNGHLENFSVFQERLASLGLAHLELLLPMLYFDVTFWDASIWSDGSMQTLEQAIHEILFPNIPFLWSNCCASTVLDTASQTPDRKWKNAKCDVQAFWSHAWNKRDLFVTSDGNFHTDSKKQKLIALAGGRIETPASAASLLGVD